MDNQTSLRARKLLSFGFFFTLFAANAWSQPISAPAGECTRTSIKEPRPLRISSAVEWSAGVAVVDPVRNAILLLGRDKTQIFDHTKIVGSRKEMTPAFL